MQSDNKPDAILAIDVGTTFLKSSLFDSKLNPIQSSGLKLNVINIKDRYSEIEPRHLLETLKQSLDITLEKQRENYRIRCLGVSVQRNSFVLWNKTTGELYTKFILWNDNRPVETCNTINKSLKLNLFKVAATFLSTVAPSQRMKQARKYRVEMLHVGPKLVEQLKILENKLDSNELKNIYYGTIDTWLIWSICKEKNFLSDVTCACCSGFYDIFLNEWSSIMCNVLGISRKILPQVTDNCFEFGTVNREFLYIDYDVPLRVMIGDSQSAFLAECAFNVGDCVITIGSGSFISVNVGNKPKCSHHGSYPLTGFSDKHNKIYIIHSPVSSAGIAVEWAKSIGLFNDYAEIETILKTTTSSSGVYFVPAFGLLEKSGVDKSSIATGFVGLKQSTSKADMLRSIFDSIAFSIKIRIAALRRDLNAHGIRLASVRLSGGVCRSEFLCQYLANLLAFPVERSNFSFTSSGYGAAFAAGLSTGLFKDLSELKELRKVTGVYQPDHDEIRRTNNYEAEISQWERTVDRFIKWSKLD